MVKKRCKLTFFSASLGCFLCLSGCSSTSQTQANNLPSGMDTAQFRQQYMELYRTLEAQPQPQPILIFKPLPKS
ncbi:hypothetical protein [Photobacterium sp. TY1-4]|uniref:hypothetical protein n=1 Tax=Photobacterium sp. TY1-4 TaxID=2899122 RepID=UPI0021C13DFD|nr:hypothetical protein [Photobacterium sp. TY1-4]UXI04422.1 hypothetical protein NH461_20255 [Photobacterium sp. TY1-4]